jgi:hypothetical protein
LESALTSRSKITENTATLSLSESALTRISLATPLESALTKKIGGGGHILPVIGYSLSRRRRFQLRDIHENGGWSNPAEDSRGLSRCDL